MKIDVLNLLVDNISYSKAVNTYTMYFDELVKSISSNGLLMKPVVIKEGAITYRLEDGHLRIEALKKLGVFDVDAIVIIPDENEKKEELKKKIDDILLNNYDISQIEKLHPLYYADQQKMLYNMIESFDKIKKDLININEQLILNEQGLLLDKNKTLSLNEINNTVDILQSKLYELNTYIKEEISFVNLHYNTKNFAVRGSEANNLVFNKIKFSNDYLNQTFASSNHIITFFNNNHHLTSTFSKNGALSGYISKIADNVSKTNNHLISPKFSFKKLNSFLNDLKIDNKLFKLKNINSFIKSKLFPPKDNQPADVKVHQEHSLFNSVIANATKIINKAYKNNSQVFSQRKVEVARDIIKKMFNPTSKKPEGIHIRPEILNDLKVPQMIINSIPRIPELIHIRPNILNEIGVPHPAVSSVSRRPSPIHIRPNILNEIGVPHPVISQVSRIPSEIHVRPNILNEIDVPQPAVSQVSRKPEAIHVRPNILNEIDVPKRENITNHEKPSAIRIAQRKPLRSR